MKKFTQYTLGAAIAAMALTSCTDGFDEINNNPNEPVDVPTSTLLTSAQKGMMDYYFDAFFHGRRGNQLAQYWSSNQYSAESRYQLRVNVTNTYWSVFYSGSSANAGGDGGMAELQEIIKLNENGDYTASGAKDNQIAVAMILKSWMFQNMTDCWGPIPYSQALLFSENPFPQYDSQEDVYKGLLNDLKTAADMINTGEAGVKGDQIFGGDMDKWLAFANSLRLRVAMRISDVDQALAQQVAAEVINGGNLMSNYEMSAFYNYSAGAPDNNPLNEDAKTRNDFAASNTMVDELTRLNDPRLQFYFAPNQDGNYVGEVYGLSEANAAITLDGEVSQRNPVVLAGNFPGIYMSYPEVEFLIAEAIERGFVSGDAATHYNNGIAASMNWWASKNGVTLDQADIDAYLAQADVDYATQVGANGYKQAIGRQKWIALYMQGIEGWTEYRRLDFGILQIPADGVLEGNGIPTRMKYPVDEQTLNGNSYKDAVDTKLNGADAQTTKLWWDVN